jgi:RNA polymerase sigma-70 factor (family 1)
LNCSNYSDSELLDAIRQGDVNAFAELFRRYWKKLHTVAMSKVRCEEVAKEIVQELFISLWEKRATLTINQVHSYLLIAIKNRILNYVASQNVLKKHWDYYREFIPSADKVTENDVQLNDLTAALEKSIEQLPQKSKLIFKLNRLDGQSIPDIATKLNLSEKAIQYHITSSLKKLRLQLRDFVLTLCLLFNFLT